MAIPGFSADSSLLPSVRVRSMTDVSVASGDAGKVVPQQWVDCTLVCQSSWSACLSNCSWWQWVTGVCVPKCRVEWVQCLRRC
jgi:hypothetical protein